MRELFFGLGKESFSVLVATQIQIFVFCFFSLFKLSKNCQIRYYTFLDSSGTPSLYEGIKLGFMLSLYDQ